MSSLAAPERARQLDEVLFAVAAGGALAAATYAAGAATSAPGLAAMGAELAMLGAATSWWLRRGPAARGLLFGSLLAVLAGTFWALRVQQNLGVANDEPGLILALHMTVPLVAASFLLVRPEIAVFALVPAVTVLGLAAGQGDEAAARAGFTLFLPLALLAVGYAMIATAEPAVAGEHPPGQAPHLRGPLTWQMRHWTVMGGSIALIMLLAQLIYVPVANWASAHRWQIIMGIASPGISHVAMTDEPTKVANYAIGRGPVKLSDAPALAFTGEYAPYWRGDVYDKYLGTSWARSDLGGPRAEFAAFPRSGILEVIAPPRNARSDLSTWEVEAKADLPFVFYAPGQATQIVARGALSAATNSHPTINGYGVAELPGSLLRAGTKYSVTAIPLEPAGTGLLREGVPDRRYLQVPLEANGVAALARKVAGPLASPARKLAALTAYLQRNCLYSTDAPAIPPGNDAVEYFVLTQKIGYCDLFASSLAIMGRAVGIPTRVVTGYAFPSPQEAQGASPRPGIQSAGSDSFLLRQSDGHAWVEAYLSDAGGWVTVDATPAGKESAAGPNAMQASLLRFQVLWRAHPGAVLAWVFGGLFVAVGLLVGFWLVRHRAEALRRRRHDPDWREVVTEFYLRLCQWLRRRGYPRSVGHTPYEYLAALETGGPGTWPGAPSPPPPASLPPLRAVTEAFVRARYSPLPVTEEMAQDVAADLAEIQRHLAGPGPVRDRGRSRPPVDLQKF